MTEQPRYTVVMEPASHVSIETIIMLHTQGNTDFPVSGDKKTCITPHSP